MRRQEEAAQESGSRATIKYNQREKERVTDSSLSIEAHTCWENGELRNRRNAKRNNDKKTG